MNLDKLIDIMGAGVPELMTNMAKTLTTHGYTVRISPQKHWIWAIPRCPSTHVCLVAHMDTIPRKAFEPTRTGTILTNKAKAVLGADDRAGVYAIQEILGAGHRPTVLLTTGEESGGVGVRDFIARGVMNPYTSGIGLFVELDRQGSAEYVYYSDRIPEELHIWAQAYGLREDYGSYSDVADLTRAYAIAHLNVSVGYMYQHTPMETLDLVHLEAAIERVCWMLYDGHAPRVILTKEQIQGKPMASVWNYSGKKPKTNGKQDIHDYFDLDIEANQRICEWCHENGHTIEDCGEALRYLGL